jgi:hypothetical protein
VGIFPGRGLLAEYGKNESWMMAALEGKKIALGRIPDYSDFKFNFDFQIIKD